MNQPELDRLRHEAKLTRQLMEALADVERLRGELEAAYTRLCTVTDDLRKAVEQAGGEA